MAQRGVNFVGHLTSNLGLGVAARNTASLLLEESVPFVAVDIPTTITSKHREGTLDEHLWTRRKPAPYDVNLFHINPPELRTQVRFRRKWLSTDGRVNACVPFWELSHFPQQWVDVLRCLDVVLAPTLFVQGLAEKAELPGVEIVHFPQTCELPRDVAVDRERWGFAENDVVFVSSFDLNSDLSRKNPTGTVEAFRHAVAAAPQPTADRMRLMIKVNNPKGDRSQASRLDELHSIIAGDPRIRVIAESLPYADVLSMYASADVFVSLHRAEGLGLGLLESMMLGTPVLATNYSGNLDFMTPTDSRLVGFSMVPVQGTSIGSYDPRYIGEGQQWAEPDLADATKGFLELMDDEHRAHLSAAARSAAKATRTNPARRAAIDHILDLAEHPTARSRLGELQKLPALYWRARGFAGSMLRATGLRR